jgi:hypothetical protein
LDTLPETDPSGQATPVTADHENIRGSQYYQ